MSDRWFFIVMLNCGGNGSFFGCGRMSINAERASVTRK